MCIKIFVICSKAFYPQIAPIKKKLEQKDYTVFLPNAYDNPTAEQQAWNQGDAAHANFKKQMFKQSKKVVSQMDAVLCLNFEKNGQPNYIGGATFLELYDAFMDNKKIFLWNDIPKGILYDEIHGFNPTIIHGNLDLVK